MSRTEKPTPTATAITAITDDGRRCLEPPLPAGPATGMGTTASLPVTAVPATPTAVREPVRIASFVAMGSLPCVGCTPRGAGERSGGRETTPGGGGLRAR